MVELRTTLVFTQTVFISGIFNSVFASGTMFIAFMIGLEIFQPKLIYRDNEKNYLFCFAKLVCQIGTVLLLLGLRYHVSEGKAQKSKYSFLF